MNFPVPVGLDKMTNFESKFFNSQNTNIIGYLPVIDRPN